MSEAAELKHELKAWERAFRENHGGRDPTKEDTKRDPTIGASRAARSKIARLELITLLRSRQV